MLNTISLRGILMDDLTATTHINGGTVYNGTVAVQRESGTVDYLPIALNSEKAPNLNPFDLRGQRVTVSGEIRTFTRNDEAAGHRHKVVVWVDSIYAAPHRVKDEQHVAMEGVLCKAPVFRVTPNGREICELLVACNRGVKANYIPVITWGHTARGMACAEVGDIVDLTGRFQSRRYEKKLDAFQGSEGPVSVWRTAYEVSAKTCRVVGMQRRMFAQ